MTRRFPALAAGLALAGALAVLARPAPAAAQDPPPDGAWRTLDTEHFRVTFQPRLEPLAREAGDVAERAYEVLSRELTEPPSGKIDVVVTDFADFTNGFATPYTSNRVVVYARPAMSMPGLDWVRDWMELVVSHELVHVFHLDRTGPVGSALRTVFGRVPLEWPLFPVVGTPGWNTEGLATYYESRLTGAGRVLGSYHDMVVRTAALEHRIPPLDHVSAPSPVWPGGNRSYIYGGELMQWIADRYGVDAQRRLIQATTGAILPTFIFFDPVASHALGASFHHIYRDWREHATAAARALADTLAGAGLTPMDTLVRRGPYAVAPRISPDGQRLAFATDDYRSDPATRILDLATGSIGTLSRRNQFGGILGPASWIPDGSGLVIAQLDYRGPYRLYSDLWHVDLSGHERRLTRGQRLASPDVAPDGRRIAAIQDHDGGLRLVVHDAGTGATRVLADAAPGEAYDAPRWSPDGRTIAVARHAGGREDLVAVDVASGRITPLTDDDALDRSPAWSPDGRWLLWSSDRTGISEIYALGWDAGAPAGPVRRVTRVLTGAFDPEVSRDGHSLYLSVYHYDGWHIERAALDTAAWQPAPQPSLRFRRGLLAPPAAAVAEAASADAVRGAAGAGASPGSAGAAGPPLTSADTATARPYSPWATVRPYYWVPSFATLSTTFGKDLTFFGLETQGWDVLKRHLWSAWLARDFDTGRNLGSAAWTYRGLGVPTLSVSASREWSSVGTLYLNDTPADAVLLREDRAALGALFLRRSWRRAAWLGATADVVGQEYQARDLRVYDDSLPALRTRAGIAAGPGFSSARAYPMSISLEDGVTLSGTVGRWWLTDTGEKAYDQVRGRAAGYLGLPLGGFADHVLAARAAGLVRVGDHALPTGVGGYDGIGSASDVLGGATANDAFPVRGWPIDARTGTRAWAATAEYRFPLHMRDAPPALLGVTLTSISAAIFADAGDAWCPAGDGTHFCSAPDDAPLASAGAEIAIDLGLLHGSPTRLRAGYALPLGPDAPAGSLYLALGPGF